MLFMNLLVPVLVIFNIWQMCKMLFQKCQNMIAGATEAMQRAFDAYGRCTSPGGLSRSSVSSSGVGAAPMSPTDGARSAGSAGSSSSDSAVAEATRSEPGATHADSRINLAAELVRWYKLDDLKAMCRTLHVSRKGETTKYGIAHVVTDTPGVCTLRQWNGMVEIRDATICLFACLVVCLFVCLQ